MTIKDKFYEILSVVLFFAVLITSSLVWFSLLLMIVPVIILCIFLEPKGWFELGAMDKQ